MRSTAHLAWCVSLETLSLRTNLLLQLLLCVGGGTWRTGLLPCATAHVGRADGSLIRVLLHWVSPWFVVRRSQPGQEEAPCPRAGIARCISRSTQQRLRR